MLLIKKKTDLDYEQLIFTVFHNWKQRSPGNIKGHGKTCNDRSKMTGLLKRRCELHQNERER